MVDRQVERGSGWSLIVQNGKLFAAMVRKPELLAKNIRTAFVVASGKLQSEVVKGFSATSSRAVSKPRAAAIGSRTGALAQSVKGTAEGRTLEDLRIVLRAGSRRAFYAATQEYGTVGAGGTLPNITPNPPRKYLTIPLPITMTARGVKRSGYDNREGREGLQDERLRPDVHRRQRRDDHETERQGGPDLRAEEVGRHPAAPPDGRDH